MASSMIKEVIILNEDYQESNQVSDQGKVQCADHSVLLAPILLAGLSLRTGRKGGGAREQGFSLASMRMITHFIGKKWTLKLETLNLSDCPSLAI